MQNVELCLKDLTETIKNSEIYKRYIMFEEKLTQHPELKRQLNNYRKESFMLHNSDATADELFEQTELLAEKYETLRSNALANSYLEAELDMCRLMKRVHESLNDAVPFLTPWESTETFL